MVWDLKEALLGLFSSPKYADNLRGVSLLEQLRAATAKELEQPSEELNAQVVDTINKEVIAGKNCWDVVDLLKKRLHSSKPHKQWLAAQLVGRVMRDCSASLEPHQEELLLEVARTMARPARANTPEGKRTRQACIALLQSFGEAGTHAYLAISRLDGGWAERGGGEHIAHSCMSVPEEKSTASHLSHQETCALKGQLRQATDKDLAEPDEALITQLVQTINTDVCSGRDSQEIADLLRQRLHSHKPHKQYLAVKVLERVMRECEATLGGHQEELLDEVAKTLMRPAKPDSDEGKRTRDACLQLLHGFGEAGKAAILTVNRSDGAWGSGETAHIDTHSCMAVPEPTSETHLTSAEARTLAEQLRAATSAQLLHPNEELIAQVVRTIKLDILNGKDHQDIVNLLKQRLHSKRPHKQWLAVRLFAHIVRDCADTLGEYEGELLEEVAKTLMRPAKGSTEEGKLTRQAAAELLRSRGEKGTAAFVAVNLLDGAWGSAEVLHIDTHSCMAVPEKTAAVPVATCIVTEVGELAEQAEANAQLLRDMLVAHKDSPNEAFETELARSLVARVTALREQFHHYMPQIHAMGAEGEALAAKAEAAVRLLDDALAYKDN